MKIATIHLLLQKPFECHYYANIRPVKNGRNIVRCPFLEKLKPYKELVGNTTTDLTTISQQECILGNVVTDAFRSFPWNDIG